MGMIANVYRQVDTQHVDGTATMVNCTNGGWSARFNTVCIVNVKGPFRPRSDQPGVMLIDGPGPEPNPIIVSTEHYTNEVWTQFGGNYLACSDTRFADAVRHLTGFRGAVGAIKIHDRVE